jgi:hypothetical protein
VRTHQATTPVQSSLLLNSSKLFDLEVNLIYHTVEVVDDSDQKIWVLVLW